MNNKIKKSVSPEIKVVKNISKIIFAIIGVVIFNAGLAQSAFYEELDTGARSRAMGGAYTAEINRIDGVFYNPAGMGGLTNLELNTSYEQKFMGLTDESSLGRYILGVGYPLDFTDTELGAAGLTINRFGLDDLYSELAIGLLYGYPVSEKILLGAHLKLLSVNYGETEYTRQNPVFDGGYTALAFSPDIGAIYKINSNYKVGLSILNLTAPDIGLKYENKVKRNIRLGGKMAQDTFNLNLALTHLPGSIRAHAGLETWLLGKSLFLRGGFNMGSANYRNLSLGLGYRYDRISVDYSWNYPLSGIDDMLGNHQVSFGYYFGEEKPEETIREEPPPRPGPQTVAAPGESGSIIDPDRPLPAHVVEKDIPEYRRDQAVEELQKGKEALERQNFAEVKERFETADRLLEGDTEIQEQLTRIERITQYVATNEFDRETISQLPEEEQKEAETRYRLLTNGIRGLLNDNPEEAIKNIAYATQIWPEDENLKRMLEEEIQERYPREYANNRFYIETNWVDQLLAESLEYFYDGRYSMAIRKCREVLELEPTNTVALTRLGSIHWARGDEDVAYSLWERVLEIDPNNQEVLPMMEEYEQEN